MPEPMSTAEIRHEIQTHLDALTIATLFYDHKMVLRPISNILRQTTKGGKIIEKYVLRQAGAEIYSYHKSF